MANSGADVWDIRLALPDNWFGLTCDHAQDEQQVPIDVEAYIARLRDTGQWKIGKLRSGMIKSLLAWSAAATEMGAACAAMRWDDDETFGMGVATLMLRRLERDAGPVRAGLDHLRPLLAKELPGDEYPPRINDVVLSAGPALRMEAIRQPPDIKGKPQHLRLVVEYWIPVADTDLVQMSFGTTNLALGADMSAEFEYIAAGFRCQPST